MSSTNTTATSTLQLAPFNNNLLNEIYKQSYFYVTLLQILFGFIGNRLNIILFTRPALRSISCSFYFLVLSLDNLFIIFFSILCHLLSQVYYLDASNTSSLLCKLRWYYQFTFENFSICCLVLASFDRFCASSLNVRRHRQICTVKRAKQILLCLALFLFISYCHMPFFYEISENQCVVLNSTYQIFLTLFSICYFNIISPCLMFLFGLLTIINIRQSRVRVTAGNDNVNTIGTITSLQSVKRKNRQLFQMLFVQIAIFVILTTIGTVTYLMITFIAQPTELLLFLFAIARLPFDTTYCISFLRLCVKWLILQTRTNEVVQKSTTTTEHFIN